MDKELSVQIIVERMTKEEIISLLQQGQIKKLQLTSTLYLKLIGRKDMGMIEVFSVDRGEVSEPILLGLALDFGFLSV